MQIILASGSARRKDFLEALGFKVIVVVTDIDESSLPEETAENLVVRLAKEKAEAVTLDSDLIIIAADTVVVFRNEILGKPRDRSDALDMLQKLSGACHEVVTGYALKLNDKCIQNVVRTKVWFRKLTLNEIESYIATKEPYDKSGSYGIQGLAAVFVDRIEGSYTNIIGLPVKEVLESLEFFIDGK
ncbi:MAG: Maf family protein [bacterium]|nr:Maf family protein [bacterium]